jgi:hypothetical protein
LGGNMNGHAQFALGFFAIFGLPGLLGFILTRGVDRIIFGALTSLVFLWCMSMLVL